MFSCSKDGIALTSQICVLLPSSVSSAYKPPPPRLLLGITVEHDRSSETGGFSHTLHTVSLHPFRPRTPVIWHPWSREREGLGKRIDRSKEIKIYKSKLGTREGSKCKNIIFWHVRGPFEKSQKTTSLYIGEESVGFLGPENQEG